MYSFYQIMQEGKPIYEELVRLSRKKKIAIADKNVEPLDAIVRQEQGVVMRLSQWERNRADCVEKLSKQLGQTPESATFLFFAKQAPTEKQHEFKALHDELAHLLAELSELNDSNRKMLDARLEYVRFALSTLSEEQTNGYDARGGERDKKEPGRAIFNREA